MPTSSSYTYQEIMPRQILRFFKDEGVYKNKYSFEFVTTEEYFGRSSKTWERWANNVERLNKKVFTEKDRGTIYGQGRAGFNFAEYGSRLTSGLLKDVSQKPLGTVATYGIGFALAPPVTRFAATPMGSALVGTATKVGLGVYGITLTERLLATKTKQEKFDIVASDTSRMIGFVSGFQTGQNVLIKDVLSIKGTTYNQAKETTEVTRNISGTKRTIIKEGGMKNIYPRVKVQTKGNIPGEPITVFEGYYEHLYVRTNIKGLRIGNQEYISAVSPKYNTYFSRTGSGATGFRIVDPLDDAILKIGKFEGGALKFKGLDIGVKIETPQVLEEQSVMVKEGGTYHRPIRSIKYLFQTRVDAFKNQLSGFFRRDIVDIRVKQSGITSQFDVAKNALQIVDSGLKQYNPLKGQTEKVGRVKIQSKVANIEYVFYNPKYPANIERYFTVPDTKTYPHQMLSTAREAILNPELTTNRFITSSTSFSIYAESRFGLPNIRSFVSIIGSRIRYDYASRKASRDLVLKYKGSFSQEPSVGNIIADSMLKSGNVYGQYHGRPSTLASARGETLNVYDVQSYVEPATYVPQVNILDVRPILKIQPVTNLVVLAPQIMKAEQRSIVRTETRAIVRPLVMVKTETKSLSLTKTDTRTLSRTMTRSLTRTRSLSLIRTMTKTLSETLTRTLTETQTYTKTGTLINATAQTIKNPPIYIRFPFPALEQPKSKRKFNLKRFTKYQPTLTAKFLKFRSPARLTGLYHRPLVWKGLRMGG
jgi:hypothetical protein